MRHITSIASIAVAGLLLAGCDQNTASNQSNSPSVAQDSPSSLRESGLRGSSTQLSNESKDFVTKVAMGNLFEIEASKIALDRANFADVKEFAMQMVTDHTKSKEDLQSALTQSNADVALPASLDMDHMAMIDALNKATNLEFDRRYIDQQLISHNNALEAMQDYMKDGDNPELRTFADMASSTVKMHLDHMKMIDGAHARRASNR
jgi:putative membrane protein